MNDGPVHWHEGMFLRPHHFQAAARHQAQTQSWGSKWDLHHNWGLRAIELDEDAIANHRLVIRSLRARLRDGTLVSVPEDGVLPTIDLKPAFERDRVAMVYLGVPSLAPGRPNAASNLSEAEGARYLVATRQIEDENTGVNPQPVMTRSLNLKLLLASQDQTGYEVLPILRVAKSTRAEATPELDGSYIPPLLACDAWGPLSQGILQVLFDRIGKKIELLANQITSRGITFDSFSQGDSLIFEQLRELNRAHAVLQTLAFVEGVHPLEAYIELSRLVGQLAIFGATRRSPELMCYDHDDLGGCFYRIKQYADVLLEVLVEPEYKERPFLGTGLRMQVALEPSWLESVWQMYVGVQSPLDPEETIRLLTRAGQLDMKIGSSERADAVFRMGLAGLKFTYEGRPPRALPALPGLIYFQISRESQEAEWQHVQRSLTLAIRLNENLIAGNIQGQRVLTIKTGGQPTTMQFTLYVVPRETGGLKGVVDLLS